MLLNIDSFNTTDEYGLYHAALRVGKWKLIHELNQSWWGVPSDDEVRAPQGRAVVAPHLSLVSRGGDETGNRDERKPALRISSLYVFVRSAPLSRRARRRRNRQPRREETDTPHLFSLCFRSLRTSLSSRAEETGNRDEAKPALRISFLSLSLSLSTAKEAAIGGSRWPSRFPSFFHSPQRKHCICASLLRVFEFG